MLKIKDLFMSIILYRFNKLLRYKYGNNVFGYFSKGSVYYSRSSFVNDSIMIEDAKSGKMTMPIEGKIDQRIIKTYPDYKIFLLQNFILKNIKFQMIEYKNGKF
jgi:hypothetical protein